MKIVLIYLPKPYLRSPDAQAPMGLLAIGASILQHTKHDVVLKNYSTYSVEEAKEDLPEADLYGITVTSLELLDANAFGYIIKSKYPNSVVLMGGPGTYSEEFVDWNCIDSILKGEGDITILDIIRDVDQKQLKKIYTGKVVDSLDDLPFPARQLLKDKLGGNIFADNKNYKGTGSTIVLSSRGCPFSCSFCSAPYFTQSKSVRYRSAKSVYNEVKHVIDTYGVKQFRFSDDLFTANKKHVIEICKELSKLDIAWRISCRVKPFDDEMASALKDGGCVELSFGIESFDDEVLKMLNKKTTCMDNVKALDLAHEYQFNARILFMIRTPGQTHKTIEENIKWLSRVPFSVVACTTFVPIPASDIWNNPDNYNIEILNRNLNDYNFYFFGPDGENELKPIIKIKNRSLEEFHKETIYFRDWLKQNVNVNKG